MRCAMNNPFIYGTVARGEYFADRESELQELTNDILNSQNVIIFSPRRYGKTSLILEVLDKVRQDGVLALYLDLFKVTSKPKFIAAYAQEISKLYQGSLRAVLKKVKDLLPRLIPKVIIKGEQPEIEFEFDPRSKEAPLLDDLLEAVHTLSQNWGEKAVVVFDEFQEITSWDTDGEVERGMRSHFQMHPNVSYIFMGSKRSLMADIFQNKNRPFYRFGKHLPLGVIPKAAFSKFIWKRFAQTGVKVTKSVIDRILDLTENHPYYTQLLCHVLWDRKREERVVKSEDLPESLEEIFRREAHAYYDLWDGLSLRAKQVLIALAIEDRPKIFSNAFLQRHQLGPASSVQRVLERLHRDEMLEKINNEYQYTDIFFKLWVRENFA